MQKKDLLTLILVGVGAFFLIRMCMSPSKDEKDSRASVDTAEFIQQPKDAEVLQWGADEDVNPQDTRLGSLNRDKGYNLCVDISNRGASIDTIHLSRYFKTVKDKHLFRKLGNNTEKYLQELKNRDDCEGFYSIVHSAEFGETVQRSLATESVRIVDKSENGTKWIATDGLGAMSWRKVAEKKDDNGILTSVSYELSLVREDENGSLVRGDKKYAKTVSLIKTYSISPDSYSIQVSTEVLNHTASPLYVDFSMSGPIGMNKEDTRTDMRYVAMGILRDGAIELDLSNDSSALDDKMELDQTKRIGAGSGEDDPLVWMGCVNKYFGAFVYTIPRDKESLAAAYCKPEYFLTAIRRNKDERTWKPSVRIKQLKLRASDKNPAAEKVEFDFYAGPKLRDKFNNSELYSKLRYADTVTSKSCCTWAIVSWLRTGLMWLLGVFSKLFLGNYGLAIILLVAVVRTLLHPLSKKGQVSMAKTQKQMAKFKPEMDRIKKKYANDKQMLNKEMMRLSREHGNPMTGMVLGCLPMMLQMPIWIALFTGLNSNVSLRHEGLLPFWLTDLSMPDALISFGEGFYMPLMGQITGFNLLPLLLTIAMYLQMKYSPQSQATEMTASAEQQQQQKMMRFMMPVMMLLFFYNAPSGLTLYIMASTFVGVIESRVIRKHIREKDEVQAVSETVVNVSGKGLRDSRPKKPKGPMWHKRP